MRIIGLTKNNKPYLISDRLRKGSHKLILEKFLVKIKDYPEIRYFETLREAKEFVRGYENGI